MSEFTFGFVRGLTIPVYFLHGILWGGGWRSGWEEYKRDTIILRSQWIDTQPPKADQGY